MFDRIASTFLAFAALLVIARTGTAGGSSFERRSRPTKQRTKPLHRRRAQSSSPARPASGSGKRWRRIFRACRAQPRLGSQLSDSIHFAERIDIPYHPKAVVIQAGGNAINAGKTPEQVLADFQAWVTKVRAALSDVRLVYLGQGPSPARWAQREKQQQANQLVRDYIAKGKNMFFVDIWAPCIGADGEPRPELYVADKLHPSAEQYQIRAKLIRPTLEQ